MQAKHSQNGPRSIRTLSPAVYAAGACIVFPGYLSNSRLIYYQHSCYFNTAAAKLA